MKNHTKNTQEKNNSPGPINEPGLTVKEYWEMRELEYQERQDYLDYINDY
jgi:hypothetical protein